MCAAALPGVRSFLAQGPADLLKPLGLGEDPVKFPLSPKSERAYHRISAEFDILFQALQADGDAPVWGAPWPSTCT